MAREQELNMGGQVSREMRMRPRPPIHATMECAKKRKAAIWPPSACVHSGSTLHVVCVVHFRVATRFPLGGLASAAVVAFHRALQIAEHAEIVEGGLLHLLVHAAHAWTLASAMLIASLASTAPGWCGFRALLSFLEGAGMAEHDAPGIGIELQHLERELVLHVRLAAVLLLQVLQ